MPDPRYERIKALFLAACELDDQARRDFLDRECADDPELRTEVESLIRIEPPRSLRPGGALDAMGLDIPFIESSIAYIPGNRIGAYRLVERVGEGTFGEVWIAEQENPVEPTVAIKIIKSGMDTREVLYRFQMERDLLAQMRSLNIVKVRDAGATPHGNPYFVMEYVDGPTLTTYCDSARLTIPQRLELFVDVCGAVHHAHQLGAIHRDLKPQNILVAMQDDKPVPKVIDFGIAKILTTGDDKPAFSTEARRGMGTLEYMSPEQTGKLSFGIGAQADVYSLGVILYELVTGTLPLDLQLLCNASFDEQARMICQEDPPWPSARLMSLSTNQNQVARFGKPEVIAAARRASDIQALRKLLARDLDWIIAKALEKDPARRYDSVAALAADARRYLSGQPVNAVPPSAAYYVSKFVRRHRVAVVSGSVVAATVIAGLIGIGLAMYRAEREAQRALQAEKEQGRLLAQVEGQRQIIKIVTDMLAPVKPSAAAGRDTTILRESLAKAAQSISDGYLRGFPEAELELRITIGDAYREIGDYPSAHTMLDSAPAVAIAYTGLESIPYADALDIHATLLRDEGQLETALNEAQEALGLRSRLAHGDRPDIAKNLDHVGSCLVTAGRLREAIEKHEESLAMRRRLFHGDHADVAQSLSNTAECLRLMWQFDRAIAYYQEALGMYRRLETPQSLNTAIALNNVANCLAERGEPAGAITQQREALDLFKRIFPGDHCLVEKGISNLANCLQDLGRNQEALTEHEAALAMALRLFRGDHPDIVTNLNNVASCLDSLNRSADALPKYVAALERQRRLVTTDHPMTIGILNNIGKCLQALKRYDEALPRYHEALAMSERILSASDPRIARLHSNLGTCLTIMDRRGEAEEHFAQAQALYEHSADAPPNHRRENLLSLIELYDSWPTDSAPTERERMVATWRSRLAAFDAGTTAPPTTMPDRESPP